MAANAIDGSGGDVRGRFPGGCYAVVATAAISRCREAAVINHRASPGHKRFVATVATRYRGDMTSSLAISGRERATVTRRALAGHDHLGVAKFGRLPARHGVTAQATDAGGHRYMYGGLASGVRAVVAAGAVGRRSERGVVGLGAFPAGRLVATITSSLRCNVPGGLSNCRTPVMA